MGKEDSHDAVGGGSGSTKVERREGWKHSKQSEQAMIADVLKAY